MFPVCFRLGLTSFFVCFQQNVNGEKMQRHRFGRLLFQLKGFLCSKTYFPTQAVYELYFLYGFEGGKMDKRASFPQTGEEAN